jgi:hypothetical protein
LFNSNNMLTLKKSVRVSYEDFEKYPWKSAVLETCFGMDVDDSKNDGETKTAGGESLPASPIQVVNY